MRLKNSEEIQSELKRKVVHQRDLVERSGLSEPNIRREKILYGFFLFHLDFTDIPSCDTSSDPIETTKKDGLGGLDRCSNCIGT